MSNNPFAMSEKVRYYTPKESSRIPVSQHDWSRLKELANTSVPNRDWAVLLRDMSLGVFASSVFNLVQLAVLNKGPYPLWVWVVGVSVSVGSLVAAVLSTALGHAHGLLSISPIRSIATELARVEGTFDQPAPEPDVPVIPIPEVTQTHEPPAAAAKAESAKKLPKSPVRTTIAIPSRTAVAGGSPHPSGKRTAAMSFGVGDEVQHTTFGRGVVESVDGEVAVIRFSEPYGSKRLLTRFAPLALRRRK